MDVWITKEYRMRFIGIIAVCAVVAVAYLWYMNYINFDISPTPQGQTVIDQSKQDAQDTLNNGVNRVREEINENTMPSP